MISLLNTVRLRLTLISAAVMIMVTSIVFLLVYAQFRNALSQRIETILAAELGEFQAIYRDGGMAALDKELHLEQNVLGERGGFLLAFGDGLAVPLEDSNPWGVAALPVYPVASLVAGMPILDEAEGQHNRIRVERLHGLAAPEVGVLMAYSLEDNFDVLAEVRRRFALVFVCILLPILVGSWLLARHTMRGVEAVTRTAVQIASGQLDKRVEPVGKGRELVDLADAFNTMVNHLIKVFREIGETNDNIAHDLRSPITRIRAAAEGLLFDRDVPDHARTATAEIVAECDGLLSVVNTMLDISEMEAGVRKLNLETVELGRLVHEACDLFSPAVGERDMRLAVELDGAVHVRADNQLLRRAVCNVLDNAVKYSNDGAEIEISVAATGGTAELTFEDQGCGISQEDLPRVFERFFRGDKARSHKGNGLGLGLVKAIVSVHGGSVSLSSALAKGTTVRIRLPLSEKT